MHDFIRQNFWIFPLHVFLTRRINKLWSKGIDKFWSGSIDHFGPKTSQKKYLKNSQKFMNDSKSSYVPKCFDTSKSYTADAH